jgi:hypothetical protein
MIPALTAVIEELAQHYRTLIDPARAGKPKDKPRVERMVPLCPRQLLGWTYL